MARRVRTVQPDRVASTIYRKRDDNRPENLELWIRGQQPPGARVNDLVEEALRVLRLYALEKLSELE